MTEIIERKSYGSPTEFETEPIRATPSPGYLLLADVLGFTRLIKNLENDSQSQRVSEWVSLVECTQHRTGTQEIQLVSDTLFVREEDSKEGLKRLLDFSKLLLSEGVVRLFPIRGAIVHGDVAWGNPTYGKAVVEAYELERSLEWIGISCSQSLPHLGSFWSWDLVVEYPVPKKSGEVDFEPAVAWNVPKTRELAISIFGDEALSPEDPVEWDVYAKVERTLEFGLYLRLGKEKEMDPRAFKGAFLMQHLELLYDQAFAPR